MNDSMKRTIGRIALCLTAGIILREALSSSSMAAFVPFKDKVLHAGAFFVLAFLADLSFPEKKFLVFNISGLLIFGAAIEVMQRYTTFRDFSMLDMVANVLGISLFYISRLLGKTMFTTNFFIDKLTTVNDERFTVKTRGNKLEKGAIGLENREQRKIEISDILAEEYLYLKRKQAHLVKEEEKVKTRIRALLEDYDYRVPSNFEKSRWSGEHLIRLKNLRNTKIYRDKTFDGLLGRLKENRKRQASVLWSQRSLIRKDPELLKKFRK